MAMMHNYEVMSGNCKVVVIHMNTNYTQIGD